MNQRKGIIEDDEEEISWLLFEVREDEIEDLSDIRDEKYIPQQSTMTDQSNCVDSDREAPPPQVATNAYDFYEARFPAKNDTKHLRLHVG